MTGNTNEEVASSVCAEADEDYVGLWSVVRRLRQAMPDADDIVLLAALNDVVAMVLSSGLVFGQFDRDLGFVPWPTDLARERILGDLSLLGRDPDIGEIGWFATAEGALS